jgi:hypothetical protein
LKLPLVLAFLAAGWASTAFARDIHVDNSTGDDRYMGQSLFISTGLRGPLRTLQKAVRIAQPGDRIVIRPTGFPFHEEVFVTGVKRPSPTKEFPIVLEGNGAMLDGLVGVDHMFTRDMGGWLYRFETPLGPTHTTDFLFVDGKPAILGVGRGAGGRPMIDAGQFAPWNGWMTYQLAKGDFIDRHTYAVSRLNVGLTIYRSNHWIVKNLDFRGYRLDGVRLHGPVEGIEFQNCRFLYNGRAGVAAKGLTEAVVSDSESIGNAKSAAVSRNLTKLSLTRVRSEGSPLLLDADSTSAIPVTAGEPRQPEAKPTPPLKREEEPKPAPPKKTDEDL